MAQKCKIDAIEETLNENKGKWITSQDLLVLVNERLPSIKKIRNSSQLSGLVKGLRRHYIIEKKRLRKEFKDITYYRLTK